MHEAVVTTHYKEPLQLEVSSFIQVAGLRSVYESTKVGVNYTSTGKVILKTEVQEMNEKWRKIATKRNYSVVSIDFIVGGGDSILQRSRRVIDLGAEIDHDNLGEALMALFRNDGCVTPFVDRRMVDVDKVHITVKACGNSISDIGGVVMASAVRTVLLQGVDWLCFSQWLSQLVSKFTAPVLFFPCFCLFFSKDDFFFLFFWREN